MIGLDIETAPDSPELEGYALQPWREESRITAVSIARSNGQSMIAKTSMEIDSMLSIARAGNEFVCTWNGVFDVAFLHAKGYDVVGIRWLDAMLLWKWYENSQHKEWLPAWSLLDGAEKWLKDWPHLDKFRKLKLQEETAGQNDPYWELRCKMDSLVTAMIAERAWEKLTPQQRRSASITMRCIVPTAKSWVRGVKLNFEIMQQMRPAVTEEMHQLEQMLGVPNHYKPKDIDTSWAPSKILSSPQQLGTLLYDTWGLECTMWTDGLEKAKLEYDAAQTDEQRSKALKKVLKCRSTSKGALTYLSDRDDRMLHIMRWRELNTQLTKFIESPYKARKYLNSEIVHPSPKLFSTYTGRMTYRSKTSNKFHTGVALHQWPRNKKLRELIHV